MFAVPLADDAELRPLEPWQAEEFLAHMDRARDNVNPYVPWATRSTDLATATATLQGFADRKAADARQLFGIWLDGTLVGGVMFVAFDAEQGTCEIGAWTEPAGQGRGLISAATARLLDYAFAERGLYRAEWLNSSVNPRSRAVARGLGFHLDGVLRQSALYRGERLDYEVWSILAPEWAAKRGGQDAA
ncbi:GNAT family N-acetyltransferase [Kitasatospora sp. NPDC096147]|uniref:GNAT family N-acetyltransferase n=1 Tax=Kitasatospora sp. NPDC096147 TaxID=3364093 RepID=UPI0038080E42